MSVSYVANLLRSGFRSHLNFIGNARHSFQLLYRRNSDVIVRADFRIPFDF